MSEVGQVAIEARAPRCCPWCGGDPTPGPCPHPNALKMSGFRFGGQAPPSPTRATVQRFSAVDLLRAYLRGHRRASGGRCPCLTCSDTELVLAELGGSDDGRP